MKYIVLLITAFASSANASTPESCIEMARDYLLSKDNAQPEMIIDNKRSRFMESCTADDEFNRALTELVFEDRVIHAIYDNQDTDQLERSLYKI